MDYMCAAYGSIISVCVSVLKSIPLVKRFPKTVTLFMSLVMPLINAAATAGGSSAKAIAAQITACVVAQFVSAVAFHETITHTVVG